MLSLKRNLLWVQIFLYVPLYNNRRDSKNFVLEDFIYQQITVPFDNWIDINVMKFAILSVYSHL